MADDLHDLCLKAREFCAKPNQTLSKHITHRQSGGTNGGTKNIKLNQPIKTKKKSKNNAAHKPAF
ncbi:hypothetical protein HRJ41_04120 [Pseudomonas sp. BF61]|uniref:hypothetical protein n=1 Tax=Pseudomonas sp. BF61 TaxID=2741068 RepID=UPI001C0DE3C7|nr:hypothetical protein [Pseudomonas sp. BF61]MBU4626664.1 hypothetical protein [Pseudomonas sp. BF61]